MQLLREGGCGGVLPPARPLQHLASLDRAAEQWASGGSLSAAAERSGYAAQATAGLHISGPQSATIALLKQSGCRTVANQGLRDVGVYQRGLNTWVVLASAHATPAGPQAPLSATRALQLVNEVRARGARCGERSFGPAPPVRLSGTLAGVAFGHANDMARHNYFEHEDLAGTRRPIACGPSAIRKNWWARILPTARSRPTKWSKAGWTAPVIAKTSWTPGLQKWASRLRRASLPGTDCSGFNYWSLRRPEGPHSLDTSRRKL
jgi:hypothetical protein